MEEAAVRHILRAILPVIFLLVIIFFVILSAFLNYHWTRFEIATEQARKVRRIYFLGSGLLLVSMTLAGLAYLF